MKFNYQIIIEYSGADYVGWQFQKNGKSIQSVIEKALYKIFKKKVKIIGSGRTDAGVNAWGQCANFYLNHKINDSYKFLSRINFYLSAHQISIINLKKRNLKFHARHSAKKRQYEYVILNRISKASIEKDKVWLIKKKRLAAHLYK